jgi:hypothetical protein
VSGGCPSVASAIRLIPMFEPIPNATSSLRRQAVRVNALLVDRPELVLGELRVGHGMYGNQTLQVLADRLEDTPARVRDALDGIVADARAAGMLLGPRDTSLTPAAARDTSEPVALAPEGLWDGHLTAKPDGRFTIVNEGSGDCWYRKPV